MRKGHVQKKDEQHRELESMGYLTIRGKIERTCLEKRYGLNTDWTKNPP